MVESDLAGPRFGPASWSLHTWIAGAGGQSVDGPLNWLHKVPIAVAHCTESRARLPHSTSVIRIRQAPFGVQ